MHVRAENLAWQDLDGDQVLLDGFSTTGRHTYATCAP
jgi:hypothetical protein